MMMIVKPLIGLQPTQRNVPNAMSQLRRMAVVITWSVVTRTVKQSFAGCVLALGNHMDLPGRLGK